MDSVTYLLKRSGNEAIRVNPPHDVDLHITKRGSDWLWAAFACFGFLMVIYIFLFFLAEIRKSKKLTKYALAAPLLISMFEFFGYFIYASNLGWTPIRAEFHHVTVDRSITGESPAVRQVFYSKYVVWVLSWPVLLFLLELTSSTTTSSIQDDFSTFDMIHSLIVQIVGTIFWVVSLLIGGLIRSSYKWGPWTFGCVSMLVVQGLQCKRFFFDFKLRGFTAIMVLLSMMVTWLYFIAWGVSEGGNKIQPDSEAVFYGVIDLCMFGILPAYLLFVTNQYGELPSFGVKYPHLGHHDEENQNEGKDSEPNSIRASGETAVPDNSSS
ncbi:Hsp30p KNAG_0J00590 [Huiozyma naganishii CBS 8797]|uniref:30 kDa heat shock protein n=1 Tax=Huiozyma naganishii (strain ATCC MYA-139 / BCRC 22969 / CBS 8797 / KCTC 17520 / NBRC 10181 / NCYC 3082 / Yp74L-3) TaxID=1071383 RepID=J7S2N3_HUIN7|nr:hypothetical protein KNAG_0J00590 [Kazachstania naganishii CBS 8797]CCK72142.1 hypothetical protein KNAG_0J00590 [Kazachstania naganishii CBS 8797]